MTNSCLKTIDSIKYIYVHKGAGNHGFHKKRWHHPHMPQKIHKRIINIMNMNNSILHTLITLLKEIGIETMPTCNNIILSYKGTDVILSINEVEQYITFSTPVKDLEECRPSKNALDMAMNLMEHEYIDSHVECRPFFVSPQIPVDDIQKATSEWLKNELEKFHGYHMFLKQYISIVIESNKLNDDEGSLKDKEDREQVMAKMDQIFKEIKAQEENRLHPEIRQVIDLGLPSGTMWTKCNVGATVPEEIGDYFTWNDRCKAVNMISGSGWQLPSLEDIEELCENCIHQWASIDGVYGRLFTSEINKNSIFFPAAGNQYEDKTFHDGSRGLYWSGTPCKDNEHMARILFFFTGNAYASYCYHDCGLPVRLIHHTKNSK